MWLASQFINFLKNLDFESLKAPEVRLIYSTKKEFEAAARKIGVMTDLKAGVPRMGYFGVVTALFKNKRGNFYIKFGP